KCFRTDTKPVGFKNGGALFSMIVAAEPILMSLGSATLKPRYCSQVIFDTSIVTCARAAGAARNMTRRIAVILCMTASKKSRRVYKCGIEHGFVQFRHAPCCSRIEQARARWIKRFPLCSHRLALSSGGLAWQARNDAMNR